VLRIAIEGVCCVTKHMTVVIGTYRYGKLLRVFVMLFAVLAFRTEEQRWNIRNGNREL